jgi:hypothetical protein
MMMVVAILVPHEDMQFAYKANPTACMQTGTNQVLLSPSTPTFNQPVQHFLMEFQYYSLKKSIPWVPSSLEPHLETHPSLHDTLMTKLPNMMNAAEACNASFMTSNQNITIL